MTLRTVKHRTIQPPSIGSIVHAPPAITLSANRTEYLCGRCEAPLLMADSGQVHGVVI